MGKIIKNGIDYGGGVAVDSALDATSMNAIANKPVAEAITQLNNDLSVFSFRNNSGTAQYSMNNGSSWTNFKNPVGTRNIYSNGTYDVTNYASAYVSVSTSLSETTLWTNSSPTSNFSGQTVSLSSSMTNYTYLKIYARRATNDSTVLEAIYPVSFFITTSYSGTSKSCAALGWRTEATNVLTARLFGYSSSTSITFGGAFNSIGEIGTKGCIPIKITGMK